MSSLLSCRICVHSQVKKGEIRGAPPPENGMGRNWAWHQVCTYNSGLHPPSPHTYPHIYPPVYTPIRTYIHAFTYSRITYTYTN